jgi:hypothetical protein
MATSSRITPAMASQLKAAIDASTDDQAPVVHPPVADHRDEPSDGLHPSKAGRKYSALERTDAYAKDQRNLLRWLGGLLATAILGWGIWATNEIASLKTATAVSQSRAEAIQAQLSRIEQTLVEIQRDLKGHKP